MGTPVKKSKGPAKAKLGKKSLPKVLPLLKHRP